MGRIRHAMDEDQRRPFAPGEVAHAITARIAGPLHRLALKSFQSLFENDGRGRSRRMEWQTSGQARAQGS